MSRKLIYFSSTKTLLEKLKFGTLRYVQGLRAASTKNPMSTLLTSPRLPFQSHTPVRNTKSDLRFGAYRSLSPYPRGRFALVPERIIYALSGASGRAPAWFKRLYRPHRHSGRLARALGRIGPTHRHTAVAPKSASGMRRARTVRCTATASNEHMRDCPASAKQS